MSEGSVDPEIIKRTQDTLGQIISAPALTDKLLSRPPVQFLQDIVKAVKRSILNKKKKVISFETICRLRKKLVFLMVYILMKNLHQLILKKVVTIKHCS